MRSSTTVTIFFLPSAPRRLVLFCCHWCICWFICCCNAPHHDGGGDGFVVVVVDATAAVAVASSTTSGHDRRYCPPPSSTLTAFVDSRSVKTEKQGDEEGGTITTKWIELKDDDDSSPFSNEGKKEQQIPRSKLVMWGPFNPVDPFQQEYFDGNDGYDYDDDIFTTTTMNNNNNSNNLGGGGGSEEEHPLRTNIWEFDLRLFNHQFPFLWQRQRRKEQQQQFPIKENCLNSIVWNYPQKDDESSSQSETRSSSSSSSRPKFVKFYVELHPSGLCRAMMESPSVIKTTTIRHHNHDGVNKNEPPNTRSIWSSLFGSRFSGTSLVENTSPSTSSSSSSMSSLSPSLPIALGSWTSRPWGVIVRLNPLDWNDDDTLVVDAKQQQQQQQQQHSSWSSLRRTRRRRRRRNGKDLSVVQEERTARWVSSQEYILTAKAFDYDFFGTNPTLSQGTIVFSNKQKKHLDRIMKNEKKQNISKQGKKQDNSHRPPLILVRDLYRDVPLVDNRYFGKFGWGKEWFLPVVGTFKASGVV